MPKVFISYSTKDKPFAKKLESFLSSVGVDAWLDEKRLKVGDSLIEKISEAIDESNYIVAVLSKSSVNSKWFQNELLWALTKERQLRKDLVLPVVIEECEIPSFLKDKYFIDFGSSESFLESINKLVDKLEIAPDRCEYCNNDMSIFDERCPHCARSGIAPNIRATTVRVEREALTTRYREAIKDATSRGCESLIKEFESAISESRAVISLSKKTLMELIRDQSLYSNYYRLIDTEERSSQEWDVIRELADTMLFGAQKKNIRFAALSLNERWLANYGECALVLRDELIAHRASVFEENSTRFVERRKIKISRRGALPPGYRASWNDRGRLCVAKLAPAITLETEPGHFPNLVMRGGANSSDDEFIEVHIWGPLTIRAVETVILSSRVRDNALTRALFAKLKQLGVPVILSKN